jgi:hypothetical protein
MLRKRAFGIAIAMVFASSLMAQNNVQITISLVNPLTNEYQMTVQNNNIGWWVDQLHVLYTTAGVLQATSTPRTGRTCPMCRGTQSHTTCAFRRTQPPRGLRPARRKPSATK